MLAMSHAINVSAQVDVSIESESGTGIWTIEQASAVMTLGKDERHLQTLPAMSTADSAIQHPQTCQRVLWVPNPEPNL